MVVFYRGSPITIVMAATQEEWEERDEGEKKPEEEGRKSGIRNMAKVVLVIFVIIAVLGAASRTRTPQEGTTEAPSQDPTGVVLAAADMPAGFTMYGQGYIYSEQAAILCGTSDGTVKGWGYCAGYYTEFKGAFPSSVYSAVLVFSDSDGAGLAFTSIRNGIAAPRQQFTVAQAIGDERVGVYLHIQGQTVDGTEVVIDYTSYEVVFRKGNIVVLVRVAGRTGSVLPDNTVAYALITEGRIL